MCCVPLSFVLQWTNPAHVGFGNVAGEVFETPVTTHNVTILTDAEVDAMHQRDIERSLDTGLPTMDIVDDDDDEEEEEVQEDGWRRANYGNPARGCRSDEDALEVGEDSVVCAPKVQRYCRFFLQ